MSDVETVDYSDENMLSLADRHIRDTYEKRYIGRSGNYIPCPDSLNRDEEAKPVILSCCICKHNEITTSFYPCMHACCCDGCCVSLKKHNNYTKCPI